MENEEQKDNTNILHKCPICLDIMDYYTDRYPKMICGKCANGENGKILDSFGNEVSFSNIDIYGGFTSYHKINNNNNEIVQKQEHICWINTNKCYANEARFGGIVIQTMK
jgi:hypothetical protein